MSGIFSPLAFTLILLTAAAPVKSAPIEFTGKDSAPMVLIPEGPFLRGSSWLNHQYLLRTTARDGARPTMRNHGTGFRCAKDGE